MQKLFIGIFTVVLFGMLNTSRHTFAQESIVMDNPKITTEALQGSWLCDDVCTPSVPCTTRCQPYPGSKGSNCKAMGLPCACVPRWKKISTTRIAVYCIEDFPDEWVHVTDDVVTYGDGCGETRTDCVVVVHDGGFYSRTYCGCCAAHGCFGEPYACGESL